MEFYTFDNTNRKISKDGDSLYDFFEKTMVNDLELIYSTYTVPEEYDARLDLVCKRIYGDTKYMEELMTQNGILNPFSIKTGDVIYYSYSVDSLRSLYQRDEDINEKNKNKILNVNKSKTTKQDPNASLPPSIKPNNLKTVDINYNKKKISIINKFK